ncbi:Fe-S cluster assembly sulfur transfer protein SufU [Deinococcus humi]|uniref:Nitrogen fixation NifU-like protein n=1 Tax=Deinococcus humi TaxID=662880 RepID=A0A7W8JPQ6_9DEIO|nr:SUF system NifU family Fe-S cluster assembly protein [Deinococcus humi]MBB5360936.1 nitrogen fixation NifU-like protein [Deinococcus humi]GGO17668.1 iron-sulfur cluster assembly scaffold protein [Deinococcus humi]
MTPPDSAMQALYKQVVMEHYRRPRNFGNLPDATHAEGGHNPSCGDQLQLMLRLDGDRIEDARFTAQGCAISVASASLMTGALKGKTVQEASALILAFTGMVRSGEAAPELGDLAALRGVHTLHTRVKCATLPWQTLQVLLEQVRPQDGA